MNVEEMSWEELWDHIDYCKALIVKKVKRE